jgi:hypothetical protein
VEGKTSQHSSGLALFLIDEDRRSLYTPVVSVRTQTEGTLEEAVIQMVALLDEIASSVVGQTDLGRRYATVCEEQVALP